MTIYFCTMPTQHNKLGHVFSKVDAPVKVSKNSNYRHSYIHIKRLIIVLCYAFIAATAFPGSGVI
jgi:hypothetical protein